MCGRSGSGGTGREIVTRSGQVMREGVPNQQAGNVIDGTFQEVFGIGAPDPRYNSVIDGTFDALGMGEPRLVNRNGVMVEEYSNRITPPPGGNYATSTYTAPRLGDMDSATYRDDFGLNDVNIEAQRVTDMMREYGITDPREMGITPENRPAMYRAVIRLLGG